MQRRVRRLVGVAAASTLVLAAAACGGDDGQSAAEKAAYCDAALGIETVPEPDIDFESMSPEQLSAAIKEFATSTFRPAADRLIAAAPEELADEAALFNERLTQLEQTGDFEAAFSGEEFEEASVTAHEYDLKNCGWEKVDVTTADYKFEDVPRTIDAGITSFELQNDGAELHEAVVFRKNDGVTESFDELLTLEEEEALEKVTPMASSDLVAPDEKGVYAVADLQPGQYIMVCFLPQGATSVEVLESMTEEAPPHFTLGMKQEFTVDA